MVGKKYGWLTDTHFDFLTKSEFFQYVLHLESLKLDGIFLTGDISTGRCLPFHLNSLAKVIQKPIYFVLGNHDIYGSSFQAIYEQIERSSSNLKFLTKEQIPLSLTSKTAIIGHDGWYDARFRVPLTSLVFAIDYFSIRNFREKSSMTERMELVRRLADESAAHCEKLLYQALETHETIYLLTHIPPWPHYTGRLLGLTDAFWMPYNSSMIMADTLVSIMRDHPDKKLVVLSGHTHNGRREFITDNIELRVGQAALRQRSLQDVIVIEEDE